MNGITVMFWRDDDRVLTRYLLGELSGSRRARLEEKLLADEGWYERLLIAEDELIDAYVRDELAANKRSRFEERFLASPERRARIELARDLNDAAVARRERRLASGSESSSGVPFSGKLQAWLWSKAAIPAFAVVGVLIVAALFWQPWNLIESNQTNTGQPAMAMVMLYPSVRSETPQLPGLVLTDGISVVELKAWVENKADYSSFRARLETSRGEALWSSEHGPDVESAEGEPVVLLRLPADVFHRPDDIPSGARHVLTIEGMNLAGRFELIDEYEFTVTG